MDVTEGEEMQGGRDGSRDRRSKSEWTDRGGPEGADRAILTISGMYCPLCVTQVKQSLLAWPGVLSAEVNLDHEVATVDYQPSRVLYRDMLAAVAAAGAEGSRAFEAVVIA